MLAPADNAPSVERQLYNEEEGVVHSSINVPVQYDGQNELLPLYVVGGDKPALLGRNWLSLDWGKIFAVRNNAQLDSLLTEFASIFSDDPGEIRGFEADVHIDDDVQPIFKKAYQVPFAIRDRIKSQLQTGIALFAITPLY